MNCYLNGTTAGCISLPWPDVGAAQNVYALMDEACKQGTAILTVMEDLEEILQVADRVAVMYNGLLSPLLPIGEVSPGHLGELMAGTAGPDSIIEAKPLTLNFTVS